MVKLILEAYKRKTEKIFLNNVFPLYENVNRIL